MGSLNNFEKTIEIIKMIIMNEVFREIFIATIIVSISGIISVLVFKNKIRFKRSHPKQAEVIEKAYQQFQDIKDNLSKIASQITRGQSLSSDDYLKYGKKVVDLRGYIERNQTSLESSHTKTMLKIIAKFRTGPTNAYYANQKPMDERDKKFKKEQYFKIVELLNGEVLKPLEKEFKKILGIKINDQK